MARDLKSQPFVFLHPIRKLRLAGLRLEQLERDLLALHRFELLSLLVRKHIKQLRVGFALKLDRLGHAIAFEIGERIPPGFSVIFSNFG